MQVGIGYSDIPDSSAAGINAARQALGAVGRAEPCDMVLLFCTARHDPKVLRQAVAATVGQDVPIYGGGAVGVITNETFGYAGDQVGVACFWLDGVKCDVMSEPGLMESELETGIRLGQRLAEGGATPDTPVMMFYDAVDNSGPNLRLLMATWLLKGIKQGLGFLPDLSGAGLQGDHVCSPVAQFVGQGFDRQAAMAMMFSDDVRIDTAIMHGCRPASAYYTVTRAEGPVILEINGKPAIEFIDELIGPSITPAQYPFFLLFGINHGEKWGEYDENNYASRLCLGIDEQRGGIVMFEPDMVAGTRFQLMFRSLDLGYMKPKIEALFDDLGDDREPVFGLYIDCAGRCAGYGGMDMEDALTLQETVAGRVPLLGLYTGVEIASIGGEPRGLDWTGVFCLFSQSKSGQKSVGRARTSANWNQSTNAGCDDDATVESALRLAEQNAAKVLQLDTQSIAIRYELEQKRRGFALLAELVVLLRDKADHKSMFVSIARRINGALNMQKTAVLVPGKGGFTPLVLQGFTPEETLALEGSSLTVEAELLNPETPVLITAADPDRRMAEIRRALNLPFFVASPIVIKGEVDAVLITGRMVEQTPFLSRLGLGDMETIQAIVALMGSFLVREQLDEAEERARLMLDATPLCANFWNEQGENIDCNLEAVKLFDLPCKQEYLDRFDELSPAFQPDGSRSSDAAREKITMAFAQGRQVFEWMHQKPNGELIPSEITLVRMPYQNTNVVIGYTRDLRELKATMAKIENTQEELREARDRAQESSRAKSSFLANMSHEIRTPMNAIIGMTSIAKDSADLERIRYCLTKIDDASSHLLGIINDILDMSKIDAGKFSLSVSDFTVEKLLEQVTTVINFKADEKEQQFDIKVDKDVPASIIADRQRLSQVITNLLSNAVKFTPEGGKLRLLVHKVSEEGDDFTLHFEVIDNGIGITAEEQTRLFKSFEQADGSISRRFGGTGLGLAISKDIVEMMGGRIWVESSAGEGSNFQFTVQVKRGAAKQLGQLDSAVNWKNVRILVVDDAPEVLEYFSDIAAGAGIQCDTAADGFAACALLEAGSDYDVIFVDWKMPGMDGIELTRKIRQARGGHDVVVVMISAASWMQIEDEARAVGVSRFIAKPLLPSPIIDCINECVGPRLRKQPAGDAPTGVKPEELFAGKRILLAEDIEINREIVTVLLGDTGITIDNAENGQKAVDMFQKNHAQYDAILMDIHMPEMDGYQATHIIRAMNLPRAASIPIIAMTANVFKEDIERCLAAGMNDHIGKPLDIDELIAKLRLYL